MDLKFIVTPVLGCKMRIRDLTLTDTDQYIPEEEVNQDNLRIAYTNNKYKYSQTYTINVINYISVNENQLIHTIVNDHTIYLDEVFYSSDKDGHYVFNHFIVPSLEWLQEQISSSNTELLTSKQIFVTDGNDLYQYVSGELVKQNVQILQEINLENTTISGASREEFSICYLYQCYINLCKQIFEIGQIRCTNRNDDIQDLIFKRDFLWMTINIIKYYVEFNQLEEAQRLLETVNFCGTFCEQNNTNIKYSSRCGCSR